MIGSIRFRLYLAFGVLTTLILMVAVFEASGMRDVGQVIERLAGSTIDGIQSLARLSNLASDIRIADGRAILAATVEEQNQALAEARTRSGRFEREIGRYAALVRNDQEQLLYRTLRARADAFIAGQDDFERQFADGDPTRWYRADGRSLHERVQTAIDALTEESDRVAAFDVDAARRRSHNVSILAASMLAATVLVALAAVLSVGVRIIEPLARLTAIMRRLAQSDWAVEVPAVDRQDEMGEMARAVLAFRRHGVAGEQATEALRALNADLERLAMIDPLTGVANRRHFYQRAAIEIEAAHRRHTSLTCLLLDIDHFKAVNDRHGHAAGDQVLKRFADVLLSGIRPYDLLGRLGGEEFAVLLPDTDITTAMVIAERLRTAVAGSPALVEGAPLAVTVSIGVSALMAEDAAIDPLLDRADRALYEAKDAGRNRVVGPGSAAPPARAAGS